MNWGGYYEAVNMCAENQEISEPVFQYLKQLENTKSNSELATVVLSIPEEARNKLNSPVVDSLFTSFSCRAVNHIMSAVKRNSLPAVEFLVARGNIPCLYDVLLSVKIGGLEMFKYFLEKFPRYFKDYELYILAAICRYSRCDFLKYLLQKGMTNQDIKVHKSGAFNETVDIEEYIVSEDKHELLEFILEYRSNSENKLELTLYKIWKNIESYDHIDKNILKLLTKYNFNPVTINIKITKDIFEAFPRLCITHNMVTTALLKKDFKLATDLYKKLKTQISPIDLYRYLSDHKFYISNPTYEYFEFFQLLVKDGLPISNLGLRMNNPFIVKFLVENGKTITDEDFISKIVNNDIEIVKYFLTFRKPPHNITLNSSSSIELWEILRPFMTVDALQEYLVYSASANIEVFKRIFENSGTVDNLCINNILRKAIFYPTNHEVIKFILKNIDSLDIVNTDILVDIFNEVDPKFICSILKEKPISSITLNHLLNNIRYESNVLEALLSYGGELEQIFEGANLAYFIEHNL